MKEDRLRAVCNICVIMFVVSLLMFGLMHSRTAKIAAFVIMAAVCMIGFLAGAALDGITRKRARLRRRQKAIREQDERDIRSGKYLYVLEKDKEPVKIKRAK